jgi:hypothetical protein
VTCYIVTDRSAPALGDLRTAGPGDLIDIYPDATSRRDFPKVWEAVGVALVRGAEVCLLRGEN